MSMSEDSLNEVADKPAVTCCRTEAGVVLSFASLEDPAIFPDLVDSGLLKIPSDVLTVRDVLGKKLNKTIDSLNAITADMIEGGFVKSTPAATAVPKVSIENTDYAVLKVNKKAGETISAMDLESAKNFEKLEDSALIDFSNILCVGDAINKTLVMDVPALVGLTPEHFGEETKNMGGSGTMSQSNGILKIKIGEGKDIDIQIPLFTSIQESNSPKVSAASSSGVTVGVMNNSALCRCGERKEMRKLVRKHFSISKVEFGAETKIDGTTLYIRKNIEKEAMLKNALVVGMSIEIITPEKYSTYSETIMDVQPIASKEEGSVLGEGTTRILDGVVMVVTGTDENKVQIGEFGSSEGKLQDNIMWGRPGAPDHGDILIKTQITIKAGANMERPGPLAAHIVSDFVTQEIRLAMKEMSDAGATKTEELKQFRNYGKKKIVIVKEIMGQGAMHDNLILPVEPVGVLGGKANVDLGNLPIMLSPLEVLDGGIHALTCIGPASKECSRHYFREPLVLNTMNDEEVDLCGVLFIGSPQINSEKFYVSNRLGMTIEALDVSGAIITTEGFGNNHIDFASHVEQVGKRGISVVAMSYCGVQGALVVGNKYMKNLIDNNKSKEGIENEILACNTLCKEDAVRALEMLKSVMSGDSISDAERQWNPNVKEKNIEAIDKQLGKSIDRSETK